MIDELLLAVIRIVLLLNVFYEASTDMMGKKCDDISNQIVIEIILLRNLSLPDLVQILNVLVRRDQIKFDFNSNFFAHEYTLLKLNMYDVLQIR